MAHRARLQTRQWVARTHVFLQIALGGAALAAALVSWGAYDPLRFVSFVTVAALGSVLKLRLPGVTGTISVSALFVLISIVNLSLPETIVVGVISMLVQSLWRTKVRPR